MTSPRVEAHRRRGRVGAPALVGAFAAGATLVVARVDPGRPGHYPLCPLYALTGTYCPLCGGLRSTHALAHLDLAAGVSYNPLWAVAAPLLVLAWLAWVARSWRGTAPRPVPAAAWWSLLAVVVIFGVLRNLPALAPWLAP
jgi:hypothetical protein